jgi:hypothetical protein
MSALRQIRDNLHDKENMMAAIKNVKKSDNEDEVGLTRRIKTSEL